MKRTSLFSALAALGFSFAATADDWPIWRGPDHNGISKEKGWFKPWPLEGPKQLWKAQVGAGFSSVTVASGRLFTIGHGAGQETVHALDANTGKELWKHSQPDTFKPQFYEGGASSTPVVDGRLVYALGNMGDLVCLDAATGKVVWQKNPLKELGAALSTWGVAGSPLIEGNLVIVNIGTAGAALDKATGQPVWESGRGPGGYATPVPFDFGGQRAVGVFGDKQLTAVDPATGKAFWKFPWKTMYEVNAADPVFVGNQVFLSSGYGTGGGLVDFGGSEPKELWHEKNIANQFNSSVLVNGHLYGAGGNSGRDCKLVCVAWNTGKLLWSEKIGGMGALTAADGKLIVLAEKGELLIVQATPAAFTPLARAQVIGGKNWTTPVLANGKIYCRNATGTLVCVAAGGQ